MQLSRYSVGWHRVYRYRTSPSLFHLVFGMHRRVTSCSVSLKRTKRATRSSSLGMGRWSSGKRRSAVGTSRPNRMLLVDGMMAEFEHTIPKQAVKCLPSTMLITVVWQLLPLRTIAAVSSAVAAKVWSVSGKSMPIHANSSRQWKNIRMPWSPFASTNPTRNVSRLHWTEPVSSGIWSKRIDALLWPLCHDRAFSDVSCAIKFYSKTHSFNVSHTIRKNTILLQVVRIERSPTGKQQMAPKFENWKHRRAEPLMDLILTVPAIILSLLVPTS